MYVCMYVRMYVCMHACMHVCMRVSIHICIYIYMLVLGRPTFPTKIHIYMACCTFSVVSYVGLSEGGDWDMYSAYMNCFYN